MMNNPIQLSIVSKSKRATLPNLVIIGAQKCATTSLHYYLGLHPQISMSREKELNFFIAKGEWHKGKWHKGVDWYRSHFAGSAKIRGEASPNYTNYPRFSEVSYRMYSIVPEAKLIYILRDPVERIISHYIHRYAAGLEHMKMSDALANLNNNSYVRRSKYYMQLEQFLNYFPSSNILIITLEDLVSDRQQTLRTVFRFLNVDDTFYSPKFDDTKHKSQEKRRKNRVGLFLKWASETDIAKIFSSDVRRNIGKVLYLPFSHNIERPTLEKSLRENLIECLSDDIGMLRKYTGRSFENWCV